MSKLIFGGLLSLLYASLAPADDTKLFDLFQNVSELTPRSVPCSRILDKEENKNAGYTDYRCVNEPQDNRVSYQRKSIWHGRWIGGSNSEEFHCIDLSMNGKNKKKWPSEFQETEAYFQKSDPFNSIDEDGRFNWNYSPKNKTGAFTSSTETQKTNAEVSFYENGEIRHMTWRKTATTAGSKSSQTEERFNTVDPSLNIKFQYNNETSSSSFSCENTFKNKKVFFAIRPASLSFYFESADGIKLIEQDNITESEASEANIRDTIQKTIAKNTKQYPKKDSAKWCWVIAQKCFAHADVISLNVPTSYDDIKARSKEIADDFSEVDYTAIKETASPVVVPKKQSSASIKKRTGMHRR